MKILLMLVVVLGLSTPLFAQTPTGYVLKLQTQAGVPVSTTPLPLTTVLCGQTPKLPTTPGAVTNPRKLAFDDPASPSTADCIWTDPGTGPLFALPFGAVAYVAVVNVVNTAGTSPDSPVSNSFTRPGTVAPALTGVRVVP